MRDLTDDETSELQQHCIFCKGTRYALGPQPNGNAMTVYCWNCRAGFNTTHVKLPWQLIAQPGQPTEDALMEIVMTVEPPEMRQIGCRPEVLREFSDTVEGITRKLHGRDGKPH